MRPARKPQLSDATLRRWLLIAGSAVTIFGIFHHLDHIVRGNHSGWPFQEAVTPFTFSLLIYALLLPGLFLTWRGSLIAGYWLLTAAVLFAVVTLAHFVGALARGIDTGHLRGLWKPRVGVSGARGLGGYICQPGGASWCGHPGVQKKRRTGTQVDPARNCARAHSRDVHTRVASEPATILSSR